MQIYVDMDGVLADFDTGYQKTFGYRPDKVADYVNWTKVRNRIGFYARLPPMDGCDVLWQHVLPYDPIILTGVPASVPEALANKQAWVRKHISATAANLMIGCRSRDKSLWCEPGDILIDDWDKYKHLWIAKGGHWVRHTSVDNTIEQLERLGIV